MKIFTIGFTKKSAETFFAKAERRGGVANTTTPATILVRRYDTIHQRKKMPLETSG